MSPDASRADSALPDIDDRLVAPDTRYELLDGRLVYVSPARPPHGERHLQLAALIEAHTGEAFEAAADLLTRTSRTDDIAPDVSVYPDAPHPETGRRQLEQLAFEIVSTQSLGNAAIKARKLSTRGVRRVFAIDVERSRALEWSAELGAWRALDPAGYIEDPALEVALPIEAMIHAAKADDAVARALLLKGNAVLVERLAEGKAEGRAEGLAEGRAEGLAEGRAEGLAEGRAEGKADAVIAVVDARGLRLDARTRERILGERDPDRLGRWLVRAATCSTVAELLAEP